MSRTFPSPLRAPRRWPTGDLIARGEYIVRLGGCNDCHTPGWNVSAASCRPRSGWPVRRWPTWGTTYPANLRLKVAGMDYQTWLTYSGR